MAICPPDDAINRIIAAIGLEKVRSINIRAAVGEAVTVTTEQHITRPQIDDLAIALETKEWVLVPKDAGSWIPASERLPEENQEVLAWNGGGQCEKPWQGHVLCEYRNGEWRESQESDLYPGITHWMPLPEPPEQP